MRKTLFVIMAFLTLSVCNNLQGETDQELSSYMLLADEFIEQDKESKDTIFYTYDMKLLEEEMKKRKIELPNVGFLQGGLIIAVISDYNEQAFERMLGNQKTRTFIVELKKDEETKQPKEAAKEKKNSRLLVIACPPAKGIKKWSIQTADGKKHEVQGEELKNK